MNKPEYIIIHHSAVSLKDSKNQLAGINKNHKERFNMLSKTGYYIGYHFLINADGLLTATREEYEVGAHCKENGMNFKSIGICLEGNFDIEKPEEKQLLSLKSVLKYLRNKYNISRDKVKFHRDYAAYKSCPGNLFTRDVLNYYMSMKEVYMGEVGDYWFIKGGAVAPDGKQKLENGQIWTVLSRELGIDRISQKNLDKIPDKKYF